MYHQKMPIFKKMLHKNPEYHGDETAPLSTAELMALARHYFPDDDIDEPRIKLARSCEQRGRPAAVVQGLEDKYDGCADYRIKDVVMDYLGDWFIDDLSPASELKGDPEQLTAHVTSFILQNVNNHKEEKKEARRTMRMNRAPRYWNKDRFVTRWQVEPEGVHCISKSFTDSTALGLLLLLDRLLDGDIWRGRFTTAATPYAMRLGSMCFRDFSFFVPIRRGLELIFKVLRPALVVDVKTHDMVGGYPSESLMVSARDERGELRNKYTSILKMGPLNAVYRAASALAFGDKLDDKYYDALNKAIAPREYNRWDDRQSDTTSIKSQTARRTIEVLRNSDKKLERVVYKNSEGRVEYRYIRDGEDITQELRDCSLKAPLDDLYSMLGESSRYGALNGCKNVAACDGLTLVVAHLKDLKEGRKDEITANFDSYDTVDLTETGSTFKLLNYFVNAAFEDDRVRRYVELVLTAAHQHFAGSEITPDLAQSFRKTIEKDMEGYRFHSKRYFQKSGLEESGRLLTKRWIKRKFLQVKDRIGGRLRRSV